MTNAMAIIMYSKPVFSIMFTPNKGRLLRNKGNKAQWMAQASEAVTPRASQLIFRFMNLQK